VTSSEIAFLTLGLVFGAAIGAALGQVFRARPAPRREVRLTITPNAIPGRRAQTLSSAQEPVNLGSGPGSTEPRHRPTGGPSVPPAAPATPSPDAPGVPATRTRVPVAGVVVPASAVAVPVGERPTTPARLPAESGPVITPSAPPRDRGPVALSGLAPATARSVGAPAASAVTVGAATAVAVLESPERPVLVWPAGAADAVPGRVDALPLREHGAEPTTPGGFTMLVRPRRPVDAPRPSLAPGAVPVAERPALAARPAALIGGLAPIVRTVLAPPSGPTLTRPRASAQPPGTAGGPVAPRGEAASGAPGAATDPCAGQRRVVDERCALADVAREQARRVADALRAAQRAYDILRERVDRAEGLADPRQVAAAKDQLHAAFRAASERARTAEETEAAARAWLTEINTLNNAVREAHRIVETGTGELRSSIGALERLSAEADAARIAAENAEAGCREAREELAGCDEADARSRSAVPPEPAEPHPFDGVWPEEQPDIPGRPAPADLLTGLPVIVRVLRGDREARDRLVAALAAGDAETVREWGLRVSRLADAIIGRAIEDGYLDLPDDDSFWRLFSYRECRDIVGALSALGFRYDGMGGFADGRAPAARDLSLAVGYAGLDRMRIRTWPRDSEIATMYERAVVAADEWLADQAGDLSLGRMVDALGSRAADLADVWNAWGRVRPALLAT
jgi:hypothetical protein